MRNGLSDWEAAYPNTPFITFEYTPILGAKSSMLLDMSPPSRQWLIFSSEAKLFRIVLSVRRIELLGRSRRQRACHFCILGVVAHHVSRATAARAEVTSAIPPPSSRRASRRVAGSAPARGSASDDDDGRVAPG